MSAKFQKLKDQLQSLEDEEKFSKIVSDRRGNRLFRLGVATPKWVKMLLFGAFIMSFLFYMGHRLISDSSAEQTIEAVQQGMNQELLNDMGSAMEEMGYDNLSRQDLVELRNQGVTAAFVSKIRDLGFENITLDEAVQLRENDVSSTFAAMMKELGYTLAPEDLIELQQHNVTAYYASNLHDLGYSDVTKEELIRLKDTGVTIAEVEQLISENAEKPSVSELIRHHISNQ